MSNAGMFHSGRMAVMVTSIKYDGGFGAVFHEFREMNVFLIKMENMSDLRVISRYLATELLPKLANSASY